MNLPNSMQRAISLFENKKYKESLNLFKRLVKKFPDDENLLFNYGFALGSLGLLGEEQNIYKKLLAKNPNSYDALVNYAVSLNASEHFSDAFTFSSKALQISPTLPHAFEARGIANLRQGRFGDAIADFKKFLELKFPWINTNQGVCNLVLACLDLVDLPLAYSSEIEVQATRERFKKSLKIAIDQAETLTKKEINQDFIGTQLAFLIGAFGIPYQQEEGDLFLLKDLSFLTSKLLCSDFIDQRFEKNNFPRKFGVLSTFKYHPERFIFDQLLGLEQSPLELVFIVLNNPTFKVPRSFLNISHSIFHVNLRPECTASVAKNIQDLSLKYLFFPEVNMSIESRILATFRLARITFTSWLHPVTTGSKNIDVFFSGLAMEPENFKSHYSERVVRLPGIGLKIFKYEKNCPFEKVSKRNFLDQPEIFNIGCVQNPSKYHPRDDFIFLELAKLIPSAKISFVFGREPYVNEIFRSRLVKLFEQNGVSPESYLCFMEPLPKDKFLNLIQTFDCCLDSFGWSGGNTTLDCLFSGVPVFTVMGKTMRANHTTGIYRSINENRFTFREISQLLRGIQEYSRIGISDRNSLKRDLAEKTERLFTQPGVGGFIRRLESKTA